MHSQTYLHGQGIPIAYIVDLNTKDQYKNDVYELWFCDRARPFHMLQLPPTKGRYNRFRRIYGGNGRVINIRLRLAKTDCHEEVLEFAGLRMAWGDGDFLGFGREEDLPEWWHDLPEVWKAGLKNLVQHEPEFDDVIAYLAAATISSDEQKIISIWKQKDQK